MKNIDVTINRLGEFKVPKKSQMCQNQCGTNGTGKYNYKISVTGSALHLDDKGFLMDNLILSSYFTQTYEKKKKKTNSCEMMACSAIKFIQDYCKKYGIKHVKRIYVEIWGTEKSYIVAEWNK